MDWLGEESSEGSGSLRRLHVGPTNGLAGDSSSSLKGRFWAALGDLEVPTVVVDRCDFLDLRRLLSSNGSPHPHRVQVFSICCSHRFRQSILSSAIDRHRLDTCAARVREVASRYLSTRRESSRGKAKKGSIRSNWGTCSFRSESWLEQHIVSKP